MSLSPDSDNHMHLLLDKFVAALKKSNFQGEIDQSVATRLVLATDNSVYQVMPSLVIFPKVAADLAVIFQLANQAQYRGIYFTVRGGGTSTNGQSLTDGVLIDCSRHLTQIKTLNLEEEWVTVEPGVVLDQLNTYLKPHGYFFPVTISTGSRVTLGGMVNTNACGKGSTFYGRTLNQVLSLQLVLADGTTFVSQAQSQSEIDKTASQDDRVGEIYRQVKQTISEHKDEIANLYPDLPRTITGYGLASVRDNQQFNLNAIVVGSEGTLAAVSEIKLKITRIPQQKKLIVIQYENFQMALEDGVALTAAKPESIETIDGTILDLARTDILYESVKHFIDNPAKKVEGLTLVEFVADKADELQQQVSIFMKFFQAHPCAGRLKVIQVEDSQEIKQVWELRKKSVGLLGKSKGLRAPVSGIEDTLVSPQYLAAYIKELRQILDDTGLAYGMFGHVDAGCLHVRPALDLSDPDDQALYYMLADKVAALVEKYKGIMWGEHGKGFRSQYVPSTFGPILFNELCKIKTAFDPNNVLNPGKIALPVASNSKLTQLDQPTVRGEFNRQIKQPLDSRYQKVIQCNGNAACFNVSVNEVMCPSYKVTRDRVHSPKGRSALLREWLRLKSINAPEVKGFSQTVYQALEGCLGCKACAKECPVQVNIPQYKALFLSEYYKTKSRNLRSLVTAFSEKIALQQSRFPRLANWFCVNPVAKGISKHLLKIEDIPHLSSPSYKKQAERNKIKLYSLQQILKENSNDAVVIVADWLNFCYDATLLVNAQQCLKKMGYNVFVLSGVESGETFKLQGYLEKHERIQNKAKEKLSRLVAEGFSLVGLEPSVILPFVEEVPALKLIQHWLVSQSQRITLPQPASQSIVLFSHCMENSDSLSHAKAWGDFFKGLGFSVRLASTGCCGMAGMYGHESEHVGYSKALYKMNWEKRACSDEVVLVTGYSCRSQLKRQGVVGAMHPLDFLVGKLSAV